MKDERNIVIIASALQSPLHTRTCSLKSIKNLSPLSVCKVCVCGCVSEVASLTCFCVWLVWWYQQVIQQFFLNNFLLGSFFFFSFILLAFIISKSAQITWFMLNRFILPSAHFLCASALFFPCTFV